MHAFSDETDHFNFEANGDDSDREVKLTELNCSYDM